MCAHSGRLRPVGRPRVAVSACGRESWRRWRKSDVLVGESLGCRDERDASRSRASRGSRSGLKRGRARLGPSFRALQSPLRPEGYLSGPDTVRRLLYRAGKPHAAAQPISAGTGPPAYPQPDHEPYLPWPCLLRLPLPLRTVRLPRRPRRGRQGSRPRAARRTPPCPEASTPDHAGLAQIGGSIRWPRRQARTHP